MIDISSKIHEALTSGVEWTTSDVKDLLQKLSEQIKGSCVDWEPGDEEWGRVLSLGKEVAFVSAKLPFAIIHANMFDRSRNPIRLGVVCVFVESFTEDVILVDRVLLSFLGSRPIPEGFAQNATNVIDIWYATV